MSQMKRGERIRELREIQNYTREAFAEKIDISPKFLYEYRNRKERLFSRCSRKDIQGFVYKL